MDCETDVVYTRAIGSFNEAVTFEDREGKKEREKIEDRSDD